MNLSTKHLKACEYNPSGDASIVAVYNSKDDSVEVGVYLFELLTRKSHHSNRLLLFGDFNDAEIACDNGTTQSVGFSIKNMLDFTWETMLIQDVESCTRYRIGQKRV